MKRLLPLIILVGLTAGLYVSTSAKTTARTTPHAPDWQGSSQLISSDPTGPNIADRPIINVSNNGNKLIIVYNKQLSTITDRDPFFSRSTNGGTSWSAPAPIHTSPGEATNSLQVHATIDANNTGHAVWVESDNILYYARESNWGNNTPAAMAVATIQVGAPQIIASGSSTLDLVWVQDNTGGPKVYHSRSTNGGTSWSIDNQISTGFDTDSPSIGVDNQGGLHVVWEETIVIPPASQSSAIMYTKGTPAGSVINWSAPIQITDASVSNEERSARRPRIGVFGNRVHVAFTVFTDREIEEVHHLQCNAGCVGSPNNWSRVSVSGEVLAVNADSPTYIVSDIARTRGCVYIYFHGIADIFAENNELIWGTNNCDNWAAIDRDQVTQPQMQSLHANLAVTDEWIHLVYEQASDQGGQTIRRIYYLRGESPPITLYLPVINKS